MTKNTTTETQISEDFLQSHCFEINVETEYLNHQSDPDENRFVFSYTIHILNKGEAPAQLLRRHWIITDADGEIMEVRGAGVVGEQPWISPGEEYKYTSGTVLTQFMGCMQGSYAMCDEDGISFDIEIPVFTLAQPDKLH